MAINLKETRLALGRKLDLERQIGCCQGKEGDTSMKKVFNCVMYRNSNNWT